MSSITDDFYIPVNDRQTPITAEFLKSMPDEVIDQFLDYIQNVPFIQNLITPDRPKAKDLPKDEDGKIIVDITKPHILEDMDYFRPAALHYEQHNCYTFLIPNKNPNSEYYRWFQEEKRRCREGYVRESDGEWVTGDMYWFLNYSPILLSKIKKGTKKADRVRDFPRVFEGIYWRSHYLQQARNEGKHAAELARRGAGKSFFLASKMAKNLILGESSEATRDVVTILTAYQKEYLADKDGTLSKFVPMIDFVSEHTEFPRLRLRNSSQEMFWQMGYMDSYGRKKGSLNSVMGVSSKDDVDKLRGKRGFIYFEEFGNFPGLLDIYNTVRSGLEDGEYAFGQAYLIGTANNKESNFESAKSLLYEPDTHRILSVNNVYDKVKQGRPKFAYFFPAFINREGCYDDNGNSDVVAALKEILMYRYDAKYSSNPNVILSRIAEYPITPSEAIIKVKNAYFPVSSLSERLQQLDTDPKAFDDIYVGKLVQNKDGIVEFVTSGDIPIRKYGVENSTTGALEIYEMPQKNHEGEVFPNRYIIGHDPVDNDQADSSSLSSTFVLDLFTDRIVAEYTGRQPFADDNFEIVRLLCLYYRATCMYESHPYSQEVIMADGTKRTWKDVHIGDRLNTIQGKTKVVNIPFDGEADVYKVTLEDGRVIYTGENHTWDVVKLNLPNKWVNISTKQMMNYGVKDKYNRHNFFVPNAGIVDYRHEDVPIDPYTFGLLLAEGAFTKFRKNKIRHRKRRTIQISSSVNDMDFYRTVIPYPIKYIGNKGCSWHVYIDDIDILLGNLGLLHHRSEDKFIPDIYKYNDYNTRMEMLKGLMDGDGCASTNGARVFITSSAKLKDDIMSLCRSLGMNCSFKVCVTSNLPSYRISIYTESNIFKLPRKIQNAHIYDEKAKGSKASSFIHKTAVKSIEFSHKEKSKCITVDRHDGLYLVGDYVLTHNCNKKGLYAYFEKMRCTHLLALTPQYLRDKQLIKYSAFGSNAYGINATAAINNYANDRINEWLKKPITTIKHVDGEDITVTMPQLYTIRSRALLEELIAFDTVRNFDRIRSLGMAMLYREEKVILYGGKIDGTTTELGGSSLADDDFFNRNYNFRNI